MSEDEKLKHRVFAFTAMCTLILFILLCHLFGNRFGSDYWDWSFNNNSPYTKGLNPPNGRKDIT